jgi:uncharacterized ParB-like nuclease family protein
MTKADTTIHDTVEIDAIPSKQLQVLKEINLNEIHIEGGTQSRIAISTKVVSEYAEAIQAGAIFPPVVVFNEGADYWLADGFHRFHAHSKAGNTSIAAKVHRGTNRDAVLYSLGANGAHGLRRTNADKRKAVETLLADAEWTAWTDHKVAEACGVSVPFVGSVRSPAVAKKQQEHRVASAAKQAAARNRITPAAPVKSAKSPPWPTPAPTAAPADEGPTAAELPAAEVEAAEGIEASGVISATVDRPVTVEAEVKKLLDLNGELERIIEQLSTDNTKLIEQNKILQKRIDDLEQPACETGSA